MDKIIVGVSGVRRQPISLQHGLSQDGQANNSAKHVKFECVNPFEVLDETANQEENDDEDDDM